MLCSNSARRDLGSLYTLAMNPTSRSVQTMKSSEKRDDSERRLLSIINAGYSFILSYFVISPRRHLPPMQTTADPLPMNRSSCRRSSSTLSVFFPILPSRSSALYAYTRDEKKMSVLISISPFALEAYLPASDSLMEEIVSPASARFRSERMEIN